MCQNREHPVGGNQTMKIASHYTGYMRKKSGILLRRHYQHKIHKGGNSRGMIKHIPIVTNTCKTLITSYQEPIREEHGSTIGVCYNCPSLKEVINSPWPQPARDQEAWVGGDLVTRQQSAALNKGQWVWCKSQYHTGCTSLRSSKNSDHMLTPLFPIYCTNSKWWISSCKKCISGLYFIYYSRELT